MTVRNREGLAAEMLPYLTRFEGECDAHGLDVLIYCTRRTMAEQARLYRQGRPIESIQAKALQLSTQYSRPDLAEILLGVGPQNGAIVTWAGPGQSLHNYGYAFDGVPMRDSKPVWGASDHADRLLWEKYGDCAVAAGLEWAGNWVRHREFPHCQMPDVQWQDLIKGVTEV